MNILVSTDPVIIFLTEKDFAKLFRPPLSLFQLSKNLSAVKNGVPYLFHNAKTKIALILCSGLSIRRPQSGGGQCPVRTKGGVLQLRTSALFSEKKIVRTSFMDAPFAFSTSLSFRDVLKITQNNKSLCFIFIDIYIQLVFNAPRHESLSCVYNPLQYQRQIIHHKTLYNLRAKNESYIGTQKI